MEDMIERIRQMECLYDEVSAVLAGGNMPDEQTMEKVRVLESYLDSGQWMHDYLQDEQGALPPRLKRGVLSQDGLYNLLADIREKETRR